MAIVGQREVLAWNATGHQVVARIAWDNMTATARQNVITLMRTAPQDSCLPELFSNDSSRPLEERQREFFMLASTWPDIVRPRDNDTRPCTRFHRPNWHFINFFWSGISGATNAADRPRNRDDVDTPELNAVERLGVLRPFAVCAAAVCGTTQAERATIVAWILHIVGDLHQPLHTSARVTARVDEREGDRGGNQFKLDASATPLSLHGYWDGILDRALPRQANETGNDAAYFARLATLIVAAHPRSTMVARLKPGEYNAWALEGFATTKNEVYPFALKRRQMPDTMYRSRALTISQEAIALGGYRLGDLLNQMFGS
jgi:truncated hemoglobin YjbI